MTSPSALRRERERRDTRDRILDAARELFVKQGIESVTMRAIANRLEYTPTAIYHHFRDKGALLQELMRHDFQVHAAAFAQLEKIQDPVERIRRTGEAYVDFGLENPSLYRFLFLVPHPEEAGDHNGPDKSSYDMLRTTVRDCVAQGRFREGYTDVEQVSQICWAACHGLVSLALNFQDHDFLAWRDTKKTWRRFCAALLAGMASGNSETPGASPGR
jgi:AcrR family transcriptional regulator